MTQMGHTHQLQKILHHQINCHVCILKTEANGNVKKGLQVLKLKGLIWDKKKLNDQIVI